MWSQYSLDSWESLKKRILFENSCPEEITPPIPLDQSSLDSLFRPSLIPEIKRKKKGGGWTKPFKILFQPFFLQVVFITEFGKQSYRISCVYLDICMSLCVFVFWIILLIAEISV